MLMTRLKFHSHAMLSGSQRNFSSADMSREMTGTDVLTSTEFPDGFCDVPLRFQLVCSSPTRELFQSRHILLQFQTCCADHMRL
jgi:hypothetical protein